MNKRQKKKVHNAILYGAFTMSTFMMAWMAILIPDGNPFAIASAIVGSIFIALFCYANKIWERMP